MFSANAANYNIEFWDSTCWLPWTYPHKNPQPLSRVGVFWGSENPDLYPHPPYPYPCTPKGLQTLAHHYPWQHQYFHSLLFSACASISKWKNVEKWQVKKPGQNIEKAGIPKIYEKAKKWWKAIKSAKKIRNFCQISILLSVGSFLAFSVFNLLQVKKQLKAEK